MSQYRLLRGTVFLGTVTHLPDEAVDGSPWDIGRLESTAEFSPVRPIFETEQRLLDEAVALEPSTAADQLFIAAATVQKAIADMGFVLLGADGPIHIAELHINGQEVHWR